MPDELAAIADAQALPAGGQQQSNTTEETPADTLAAGSEDRKSVV